MNNLTIRKKFLKILISITALFFLHCNADQYPYYMEEVITNFTFTGYNFSIIVDSSGSMLTDMSEIQSELYSLINAKSNDDYIQIISTGPTPTLEVSWTTNDNVLLQAVDNLRGTGAAERYDLAISRAANHSQSGKINIILLFGDGEIYGYNEPSQSQILGAVANAAAYGRSVVYTLGTGNANSTNLWAIANQGNGQYYDLATSSSIGTIFNDIKKLADGWIETDE